MASNYTTNYQLNQWAASDQFLRTEFNADNQKIDAALKALNGDKAELVFGSYTGDGTAQRTISLGFTPKAVLSMKQSGQTYGNMEFYGGLAWQSAPVAYVNGNQYPILILCAGGFAVYNSSTNISAYVRANYSGETYHYMAVK